MKQNKPVGLSREDLQKYRNTADEKVRNAIEKRSMVDDFDSDALEGWSDTALSEDNLRRIDKKFTGKNYLLLYITGTMILVIGLLSILLLNRNAQTGLATATTSEQTKIRNLERTDIVLPPSIEEMEELPKSKQIKALTVIREFEEQRVINEQESSKSEEVVTDLPIHTIESPQRPEKTVRETIFGKEIYLSDLKVLDYRAYRSKPSIQTTQLDLTGTPADQSEPGKIQEDEFTWKTVDIPYIDYLEKSMYIFARGNNKKALARFEEILKTYPDDVNALFYSGLCYYNLNEFEKATIVFEKCAESRYSNFSEEAFWYLAKSLFAGNDLERAKQILAEIRDGGGYYSKQAEKLLK
ncbi:MAG: tetratricopeptide repeat protein [Bacteroidota bacterium]